MIQVLEPSCPTQREQPRSDPVEPMYSAELTLLTSCSWALRLQGTAQEQEPRDPTQLDSVPWFVLLTHLPSRTRDVVPPEGLTQFFS
jgi:hypothetical protein